MTLVAFTIEEEEWFITFLFLIPIYFYAHYLIVTKFGFNKNLITKKGSIVTIILSVITLILIGIVPLSTWNSYNNLTKLHKTSINWGTDTTVYNIRTNLKTKLI